MLDCIKKDTVCQGLIESLALDGRFLFVTRYSIQFNLACPHFAYESALDEKYLITATKLANSAIEEYYVNGKWKFSRGKFETDADIYDSSYPSSVSTMISLLYSLSSLVDIVYKKFVFKTLEIYSYDVMRQPISTPKMSRMVIRYLKDDIIIKAKEEKLGLHITELDSITYPFTLIKNGYVRTNG